MQETLIQNTLNHIQKKTFLKKSLDGDFVGITQAGSFRELGKLGATKYEYQMDSFAFSEPQDSNRRDTNLLRNTLSYITVNADLGTRIQICSSQESRVGISR